MVGESQTFLVFGFDKTISSSAKYASWTSHSFLCQLWFAVTVHEDAAKTETESFILLASFYQTSFYQTFNLKMQNGGLYEGQLIL